MRKVVSLCHRTLLSLRGKETLSFLQNLVTSNIEGLSEEKITYTFLLNAKGRVVQDLFLLKKADQVLLECDRNASDKFCDLLKRFVMHKDVVIEPSEYNVYFIESNNDDAEMLDPRVPCFGKRIFSTKAPEGVHADLSLYHSRRYDFGIPEGTVEVADGLPLFRNADLMNGISCNKGCYIGQETSAVALNATTVRQRTMPFTSNGIVSGNLSKNDGEKIGKVLCCNGRKGLAQIKLTSLKFPVQLNSSTGRLTVFIPKWWPANPQKPCRL